MRRAIALPLTLCALIAAATSALPTAAATAAPTKSVTLEGTYQHVVADAHNGRDHDERDLLVAGGRAYTLTLPKGHALKPGAKLKVKGRLQPSAGGPQAITADETTVTATAGDAPSATTQQRVLVILASWTGPDAVTPEQAHQQFFVDDDAWYREVSYGALGLTGDVTPWLSIAGPDDGLCYTNHRQTMSQAKEAALAAGFDAAQYDRTVLYFPAQPNSDCSMYGGWAYQPGTEVWLNGEMNRRTTVHEIGHTLGLGHAHGFVCKDAAGVFSAFTAEGCMVNEYGDVHDAMGASGYVGHFSSAHKSDLGWGTDRMVDLSHGGTATLAPLEGASGVIAARFSLGTRTYWFEHRAASGVDALLPATATEGLLVRVTDSALAPGHGILDLRPDGDLHATSLAFGGSWQLPEGPWVSVGMPTAEGVPVTIGEERMDVVAPNEVTDVAGRVRKGHATLTWHRPQDDDLRAVRVRLSAGEEDLQGAPVIYEGLDGAATFTAPPRSETWTLLITTLDSAGNESAGVILTASWRKVIV